MIRNLLTILLCLLVLSCMFKTAHAEVRVIDGDTIAVNHQKWRLAGVNCDERGTPDGSMATSYAVALVMAAQGDVSCHQTDGTSYDRIVGRCEVGGVDLGQSLISVGVCGRCPRYDPSGFYVQAQIKGDFHGRFPSYCRER